MTYLFSTVFAVHGLAESMEKRSFALFRVLGSPLCTSSVRMVSHCCKAFTNTFLGQSQFWMSCINIARLRQKKKLCLGFRHFVCTQHLSRYASAICICVKTHDSWSVQICGKIASGIGFTFPLVGLTCVVLHMGHSLCLRPVFGPNVDNMGSGSRYKRIAAKTACG